MARTHHLATLTEHVAAVSAGSIELELEMSSFRTDICLKIRASVVVERRPT